MDDEQAAAPLHDDKTEEQSFAYKLATLNDRFAAFVTDGLILGYLIWAWSGALSLFFKKELSLFPHFQGFQAMLFFSTSFAFVFLYYLIGEGIFSASLGKLLVGIRVMGIRGTPPSLWSIIARNLIRFLDLLVFPILLIAFMEGTEGRQRFGDFLARTTVVRRRMDERIDETRVYASTLRRFFSLLFDLVLFCGLMGGILLLIPAEQNGLTLLFLNLIPLFGLIYIILMNLLFEGSPGKLLLGIKVSQESGRRIGFAGTMTRSFFIPFDINPVSYLCTLLSKRRQRPGDVAAATVVIKTPYRWYYPLVFLMVLVIVSGVGFVGWNNPRNFVEKGYQINLLGQPLDPSKLTPYTGKLAPYIKEQAPVLNRLRKLPQRVLHKLPKIPFLNP
ncbi:MAG: RDD family protein [Deltaproteobacteria bacterium]|nr:RDD family protein [Deltaproteobacteria bacterium]